MKLHFLSYFFVFLMLFNSCVPYSSLLNYNEAPTIPVEAQAVENYQPLLIQANDILNIRISSIDEIAAQPFEIQSGSSSANSNNTQGLLMNGYLVNAEGYIDFPTLGQIQIGGLTMEEAKSKILTRLDPYFEQNPIINIRLLNFTISVNGEVNSPGILSILNERITLVEAVTMAGDFTDYSRRDSILIVRESNGERSFGYVNFNSAEIFTSPYFYLQQNDVIYVRPEKRKTNIVSDPANRVFAWVSALTGTAAFILSVTRRRN